MLVHMPTLSPVAMFADEIRRGEERRREPRVPMDVEARVKCLDPLLTVGPSTRVRIVEISRSGMKIRAHREFQHGGVVQVIVKNTFFMGTIRHCQRVDGAFDTGLKLTESFRSSLL